MDMGVGACVCVCVCLRVCLCVPVSVFMIDGVDGGSGGCVVGGGCVGGQASPAP